MTESSLTMNRWWHRHRRSPLCPSLYAVCFVIVLSFILFEVLDVDGSDFQVPTGRNATLRATTAEEHADILRSRSEEHTSELQSLTNLVCRLLLEKKKQNKQNNM